MRLAGRSQRASRTHLSAAPFTLASERTRARVCIDMQSATFAAAAHSGWADRRMSEFDLKTIPFTLAGSFLRLSTRNHGGTHRVALGTSANRAVSRKDEPFWAHDFFEFALFRDGIELPYVAHADASLLELSAGEAQCSIVFQDADTLRFIVSGAELRLLPAKPFAAAHRPRADLLVLMDYTARGWHLLRTEPGTRLSAEISLTVSGVEQHYHDRPRTVSFASERPGSPCGGALRFRPHEERWTEDLPDFAACRAAREAEFAAWMRGVPTVLPAHRAAAQAAWFILWGCRVPVGGALTRPVLFMSKFWMNKIWAWDNTFNALALVHHDPALAWDQLHVFFDHQGPNGVLPDTVSDLEPISMHVKPPVYGWAISRLIDRVGEADALPHIEQLYEPVARLTEWWFDYRDHDGNGVCQYHHGNDSGWDNGTSFDIGHPNESPDLGAWLVLQCEALARMAALLGRPAAEADRWRSEGEKRLAALLEHNVCAGRFVGRLSGTETLSSTDSLLLRFPIFFGKRLPADVYQKLLEDLRPDGPFLTRWGLASESPASPLYEADGYWRGPIWGVSNFLVFDALVAAGETDLARELATRACNLCVEHPGFWENYDALTGRGLRCPAYTWTAATFLLMAEWLAANPR